MFRQRIFLLSGFILIVAANIGCDSHKTGKDVTFNTITIQDLEALDITYKDDPTNAIAAIERMSESEICDEILNEAYTGSMSICLSKSDSVCLVWSKETVGKESFIQELERRYSGTENCESINKRIKDIEKSPPNFVLIDSRQPAYCTLFSFSDLKILLDIDHIPRDQLARMTADFNQFKSYPGRYLDSCVIVNEYKKFNYRKYFPKLLEKHKGTPFGLTWNGGLAFTWNDYRHAEELHNIYRANPQNYLENSERSLLGDPINPAQHLFFFLP